MYNNGYNVDNREDNRAYQDNASKDYYRNDVPINGGQPSKYNGESFEEMLSRSSAPAGGYPMGGYQASAGKMADSNVRRSQTVYAEPEEGFSAAQAPENGQGRVSEASFNADIYPSVTTMQFKEMEKNPYEDYRESENVSVSRRYKISAKGKVLVAVYALVVAIILILIVLNTSMLKSMNNEISAQHAKIAALSEENAALNTRLEYVMSDETIAEKAAEFGMIHE